MAATVLADIIANGVFLQTVGMGMLMGSLQGAIASGGDMNAILAGAVSGAASSMIFYGVGQALGQFTSGMDPGLAYITKVVAHAGVGCLLGAAGGGDCKSGAASAAVSKAVTPITDSVAQWADNAASVSGTTDAGQLRATVGAIQNAIVGGTASVAAGGKFANGAMNGAFGYLFNELSATRMNRQGYTGLDSDLPERANALRRIDPSNVMSPDYVSATVQIGPLSVNYTGSLHDSANTGGWALNTSMGLSLSVTFGAIQLDSTDRSQLTRDFIDGRSGGFSACYWACAGINVSYDGQTGRATSMAREQGVGVGFRGSTGALVKGPSFNLSVGSSKP